MYQALPYKLWHTKASQKSHTIVKREEGVNMKSLVDENAVVILGKRGCCMNYVVRHLLAGIGVNPVLHEIDETDGESVTYQLKELPPANRAMSFPTVFVGGRWYGDLDKVIATHITGELTPILKDAGALWLSTLR